MTSVWMLDTSAITSRALPLFLCRFGLLLALAGRRRVEGSFSVLLVESVELALASFCDLFLVSCLGFRRRLFSVAFGLASVLLIS